MLKSTVFAIILIMVGLAFAAPSEDTAVNQGPETVFDTIQDTNEDGELLSYPNLDIESLEKYRDVCRLFPRRLGNTLCNKKCKRKGNQGGSCSNKACICEPASPERKLDQSVIEDDEIYPHNLELAAFDEELFSSSHQDIESLEKFRNICRLFPRRLAHALCNKKCKRKGNQGGSCSNKACVCEPTSPERKLDQVVIEDDELYPQTLELAAFDEELFSSPHQDIESLEKYRDICRWFPRLANSLCNKKCKRKGNEGGFCSNNACACRPADQEIERYQEDVEDKEIFLHTYDGQDELFYPNLGKPFFPERKPDQVVIEDDEIYPQTLEIASFNEELLSSPHQDIEKEKYRDVCRLFPRRLANTLCNKICNRKGSQKGSCNNRVCICEPASPEREPDQRVLEDGEMLTPTSESEAINQELDAMIDPIDEVAPDNDDHHRIHLEIEESDIERTTCSYALCNLHCKLHGYRNGSCRQNSCVCFR